jgi:hypothetical protein
MLKDASVRAVSMLKLFIKVVEKYLEKKVSGAILIFRKPVKQCVVHYT